MSIVCPHSHEPAPHIFSGDEQSDITAINECFECHGLIQYCPYCEQANRLAAHHCVQCGHQLAVPTSTLTQLIRPGEIRQAALAPDHYSLNDCLQLSENHRPFMWFSALEGLLVLSRDSSARGLPLALHFLPGYRFDIQAGLVLTTKFLPYTHWIQLPLVSEQGLFVASDNELQYFPSHGYQNLFAQQRWQPPIGSKIRAIALDSSGHPIILVSDHSNHLRLLLGNTQSGEWGNPSIDLDKPAEQSGYAIAIGNAMPDCCAVYDGNELILIDLKSAAVQKRLELTVGVKPALLFDERARLPYFEPFLIGTTNESLRCIIPITSKNAQHFQAGVVRFDGSAEPTKTQEFPLGTWLLPDPWGNGFMVWSKEAVQRYEGHQPSLSEEGGNFSGLKPLLSRHWLVGQTQIDLEYNFNSNTEIVVFSAHQQEDRYQITLECRPTLSNIEGNKIVGMPPLHSKGRLLIALRQPDESAPVIVYTLQIAGNR